MDTFTNYNIIKKLLYGALSIIKKDVNPENVEIHLQTQLEFIDFLKSEKKNFLIVPTLAGRTIIEFIVSSTLDKTCITPDRTQPEKTDCNFCINKEKSVDIRIFGKVNIGSGLYEIRSYIYDNPSVLNAFNLIFDDIFCKIVDNKWSVPTIAYNCGNKNFRKNKHWDPRYIYACSKNTQEELNNIIQELEEKLKQAVELRELIEKQEEELRKKKEAELQNRDIDRILDDEDSINRIDNQDIDNEKDQPQSLFTKHIEPLMGAGKRKHKTRKSLKPRKSIKTKKTKKSRKSRKHRKSKKQRRSHKR
jgi:hypothetical protein